MYKLHPRTPKAFRSMEPAEKWDFIAANACILKPYCATYSTPLSSPYTLPVFWFKFALCSIHRRQSYGGQRPPTARFRDQNIACHTWTRDAGISNVIHCNIYFDVAKYDVYLLNMYLCHNLQHNSIRQCYVELHHAYLCLAFIDTLFLGDKCNDNITFETSMLQELAWSDAPQESL